MWIWAAFICYNTECLPPVAKIEPPPAAVTCPKSFRAKNYAKSNEPSPDSWKVVCAETVSFVYGGISFYDGEGITGEGGLLRLNRETKKIEVRRLPLLRKVSVNSIAADGDVVWFGTRIETECIGYPFAHGLVRYDWKTGAIQTWEGKDDGPIDSSSTPSLSAMHRCGWKPSLDSRNSICARTHGITSMRSGASERREKSSTTF